jgi:ubiquinone/menaquinone biosynthesis C-methylase UbiE
MERLVGYYLGYAATHLIRLGVDSGLFEALADHTEGTTATGLSNEMGFNTLYVEHFLRSACALHLVDFDPSTGNYRFAPHMDVMLAKPKNYRYLGNLAQLYIIGARDFDRMHELLKTGGTYAYLDHGEDLFDSVAHASEGITYFLVKVVVPRLPGLRGRDNAAVLDIGCGEGSTVIALAHAFPEGRAVGIDIEPHSIEKANARIRTAGLEDRAEARLVAAEELDEVNTFDLVTLVQVLHETNPEARNTILTRAYKALRSGGSLVIIDEPYPNDKSSLRDSPIAVLTQFIEVFWGSVLISPEEQKQLAEDAGFKVLSQMIPAPGLICITIAEKS